jgi:hypothetical protein
MKNNDIIKISEKLAEEILKNDGFTYSFYNADFKKSGFAVALPFSDEKTYYYIREFRPNCAISERQQLKYIIKDYIKENKFNFNHKNICFGAWVEKDNDNDKTLFLDFSEVLQDKSEALKRGKERGEKAIFDLSTFETIYIK